VGLDFSHMRANSQTTAQLFVTCFMGMVGTVAVVWLFTTKVDKKSFTSIGFDKNNMVKDIALGLAMGFVIMLSGFSILVLTHQLQFVDIKFNALNLVYSVGIFVFVAVNEEVFTRGYILRNLAISFNKYVALVVSALIFSLMHLGNPNINLVGLSIIFLSGLVLGLPYLYTRNLWFPIALHISWNFFQGPIFGFNVSGLNLYKLIETKYATPNNWNGGEFGFEGSILAIFFLLAALTAIHFLFKNRKSVEEPEVEELDVEIETT